MLRRVALPALLTLLGTAAALLVARLPPDLEHSVVTPLHHGADPLLSAALLRFGATSLLEQPSRYFDPPILYPDRNPLRGTEPLVAEALLALPFRLVLGDRPAPVYTATKIATLALLALGTGLLLRELGSRFSLCVLGGCLAVLATTTAVFVDRIQAVSLQWLPLGALCAARFARGGRRAWLLPMAVCALLAVQASLYTSVMLLGLAPFLAPLALALAGSREARTRAAGLGLALLAAALVSLAVLRPYLEDRRDVAAYAAAAYLGEKSWNPAFPVELLISPPEYGPESWPLRPHASWNGFFPGHAFLLLVVAAAILGWLRQRGASTLVREDGERRACRLAGRVRAACLAGLAAALAAGALLEHPTATRLAADALLWGVLGAWSLRLALWPRDAGDDAELARAASAAWLSAFVLLVLSFGSPIRLHHESAPALVGVFGPLSSVLAPLRELRELRRFLVPAGWLAVAAATLALEQRLRGRTARLGPILAAALLAAGFGERLSADVRKAAAPPPPAAYAMLRESRAKGGLLELPVDGWGQITSIHRMLWQPSHGRPILAGRTGLDPAWYHPAREVLNEFPSAEGLALARAWGLDSVLDTRPAQAVPDPRPDGVVPRAEHAEDGGTSAWRLFDLEADATAPALAPEPEPGPGRWEHPASAVAGERSASSLATDGSTDTAGEVAEADGVAFVTPEDALLTAAELDYGPGRFSRVPRALRIFGLAGSDWVEMTDPATSSWLRARAANLLLRERTARLVVRLRPGRARVLRLVGEGTPWQLPEIRVRVAPLQGALTARP